MKERATSNAGKYKREKKTVGKEKGEREEEHVKKI